MRISGRDGDGPGDASDAAVHPDELRPDPEGPFQLRMDLVTVSDDGLIHVLDQDQLALVSFDPEGLGERALPADGHAARFTSENTIGLFLDVERHEAARLAEPSRPGLGGARIAVRKRSRCRRRRTGLFLGEHPPGLRDRIIRRFRESRRSVRRLRIRGGVHLVGPDRVVLNPGARGPRNRAGPACSRGRMTAMAQGGSRAA